MNIHPFKDYPTKPADVIERGAATLSRLSGVVAFCVVLASLLYLLAR